MKIRRRKPRYIRGDHLMQDDLTGEIIRRSQAVKLWDGNFTARWNYEKRNPQDFLKSRRERQAVKDARPRTEDYVTQEITADDL